jgi:enamine deaminase RidA (YjgF/YER057c/UK114 family)
MPGRIDARLAELGLELPEPPKPAASYVPFVQAGGLTFVSGQVSNDGKELVRGILGESMGIEEGQAAARLCALNLIAQAKAAAGGDLDRVRRVVKLTGFVNSAPAFGDQPKVINGASDLIAEVFGPEVGAHSRSAVGVAALPFGVAVEIEAIFEIA